LADDLHSANSKGLLSYFEEGLLLPRRFLSSTDSDDLYLAFFHIYSAQQLAGRLWTECQVALDPHTEGTPEQAFIQMYDPVHGALHVAGSARHDVFNEPKILPAPIPAGVVLDLETQKLWRNDVTTPGLHPSVTITPDPKNPRPAPIPTTVATPQRPKGGWVWRIPKVADFDDLTDQVGRTKPEAWLRKPVRTDTGETWPSTWKAYLTDVGLAKAMSNVPATGDLAVLWTQDKGGTDHKVCFLGGCVDNDPYMVSRWSGRSAADGTVRYYPFYYDKDLCSPDTRFDGCKVYVHNSYEQLYQWFDHWVASTVYTTDQLKDDNFVTIDLTPITPKSSS
jgi:hypothetical protein